MSILKMRYKTAFCTDKGRVRASNQDAVSIRRTIVHGKEIILSVVCDGMGGLDKGELASAMVVSRFEKWFAEEFPKILKYPDIGRGILDSWDNLLREENEKLVIYGREHGLELGTTVTAMLFVDRKYYLVHVGDSRAYELAESALQLTHDHTVVAYELEKGLLTEEQANKDTRRNVLLQCIGVTQSLEPDYIRGDLHKGAVYLLCSDGFWNKVSGEELCKVFYHKQSKNQRNLEQCCREMVKQIMERGERDNISVVAVYAF